MPRRRSRRCSARRFPGARTGRPNCRELFAAYVEAKQRQNVLDYDDLLLYWAHMLAEPRFRGRDRRALRSCPGRRISGHQPAAGLDPAGAEARRARPDGGRRRRAVDLFVPRRDRAQHPGFSRPLQRRRRASSRWSTITARRSRSSPPRMPSSRLAAERFTKNLWSEREASARPLLVAVRDEARSGALRGRARAGKSRGAALPLKSQAVLFRTSHHSATLEFELTRRNIPFVKFGGLKFLEAAHVKDVLAALRLAENPRDRVAGFRVHAACARHRPRERGAHSGSAGSARSGRDAGRPTRRRARAPNGQVSRRCSTACSAVPPAGRANSSGAALV